jgi:rhodanese-related sulfurtransferase
MKHSCAITAFFSLMLTATLWAHDPEIPESKQTTLGLYVSSAEAYKKWKADPDNTVIIDVRTPEEYIFVGHAEMAYNVPLKFQLHQWDAQKGKPAMRSNPDFVDQVKAIVKSTDTVLVTCRSGKRGAPAVDLLAAAGLENVHHVVDGFEGDMVKNPDSQFNGKRKKNGWKNTGLPWTYDLVPKQMYLAASTASQ